MRLQDAPRNTLFKIRSHNEVWALNSVCFVGWYGKEVVVCLTDRSIHNKIVNPRIEMLESVFLVHNYTEIKSKEIMLQ